MRTMIAGAALAAAFGAAAITPAVADPAWLKLTYGGVASDPAGAFVNVQVDNAGTIMISQIVVSCDFFAKKKKIGTSSTVLFSSFPGISGQGQVRLMGATNATSATCAITSPSS